MWLPLGEANEVRKAITFFFRSTRPLDPDIMFTRSASICITSLIAARPYETFRIIWFIGKSLLVAVAGIVVVGPEVYIVIRPLGILVDLFMTCGEIGQPI